MRGIKEFIQKCGNLNYFNYKLVLEVALILNLVILAIWFNDFSVFMYSFVLLFFTGMNLILPKIFDKIFLWLSFLIFYLYFTAQEIYYSAFQQYFLFSTAFGAKEEMAGVSSSVMELITPKVYWVLILLLIQLVVIILVKTKEKLERKSYFQLVLSGLICSLLSVGVMIGMNLSLEQQKEEMGVLNYYGTPHYFFNYLPNSNVVVDKFSIFGLLYRDTVGRVLIQHSSQYGIDDELIIEVMEEIGQLSRVSENEYTGIFEGKSLVIIQAESLMNVAIDEDLTPALHNLKREGLYFEWFNAPLLYGSTSDTEFMANTGLFPVSTGEITFDTYNQNNYVTTLAKLFSSQDYYSSAYHSNYANYYSRNTMYPQLGYEFYDMQDIGISFLEKDSVTLDKIKWIYNWAPQYLSYFITYNGHQPYSLDQCGNTAGEYYEYPEEYYERIDEKYPDIDSDMKCYYAKTMDLDKGIERYVEDIKNNEYDVVLVVLGDHYAKAIDIERGQGSYTPLIIWEKDIEATIISKRTSTVDILPTLANMFNLEYDERTVFGRDIMDESYDGFYFNSLGQIVTNDFQYNSSDNSIELLTDKYTQDEVRVLVNQYILRMNVSRTIVETDFFSRYPNYGVEAVK